MITFDEILPMANAILRSNDELLLGLEWLLINRDLNGKVRLILPNAAEGDAKTQTLTAGLVEQLSTRLSPHVHPKDSAVLYESSLVVACNGAAAYLLDGFENVWVVERLAIESNWTRIEPETSGAPRIVFFSIKGGVGRSTALAATAWSLAQTGKRVLVLDLDLESPGLSSALLPPVRQPKFGITDWLIEDLVDNGGAIFDSMIAMSNLSHDGEIHVVPAHGANHGEYIAKLGRVWMPKLKMGEARESWSTRLGRLLQELEDRVQPDVILIDSRSGIDEIASTCITDIGASLILLFALDGDQTWNGYRMLFEQWQRAHVVDKIRDRLKIVGAIVPELDRVSYIEGLRESAYGVFGDTLYDEIAPANPEAIGPNANGDGKWRVDELVDGWNFDEADEGAPHYPWAVNWHRSFAGLRSLQGRLSTIDVQEVHSVFGSLIGGVNSASDRNNS